MRLNALIKPKEVPYGRVVDNKLLRHVLSTVVFPARAWHVIIVFLGLTLWSGQLPPQLHVILAQMLRYQSCGIKENQRCEFSGSPVRKRDVTFNSHSHSAEGARRETAVRMSIENPLHHV